MAFKEDITKGVPYEHTYAECSDNYAHLHPEIPAFPARVNMFLCPVFRFLRYRFIGFKCEMRNDRSTGGTGAGRL